jgi:hypothetical protein
MNSFCCRKLLCSRDLSTANSCKSEVLYGCETWCLILREEHSVFENMVLRRIFGPRNDEVTGGWRNCTMWSFVICTLHQV